MDIKRQQLQAPLRQQYVCFLRIQYRRNGCVAITIMSVSFSESNTLEDLNSGGDVPVRVKHRCPVRLFEGAEMGEISAVILTPAAEEAKPRARSGFNI